MIEERTDASRDIAQRYGQIRTLLADPNVYSGTYADPILWLKKFGNTFLGMDMEGVAPGVVAEKVRSSTVGKIRQMAGDTRMSDADRKFYVETIPGLGDDPESIALSAEIAMAMAQSNMDKEAKLDHFFGQIENPTRAWRAYRDWERKQSIWKPDLITRARAKAKKVAVKRGPLAGVKPHTATNPITGKKWELDPKTNSWVEQ